MKARAVRLSEPLLRGVEILQRRESLDASSATRKLLKMGLERYIAQLYAGGDLTLREAASLLQLPLREAVEELGRLGVPGNVTAAENLKAFEESRVL